MHNDPFLAHCIIPYGKIISLQWVNHVLECLLLGPRQGVGELLCFIVRQSVQTQNF